MKKVALAAIVLAAVGAGVYLYLTNKIEKNTDDAFDKKKELIGKWKTVSQSPVFDTVMLNYQYEFGEKGLLVRSINDSARKDTGLFTWINDSRLSWQFTKNDSSLYSYTIKQMTSDSLVLQSVDSVRGIVLMKEGVRGEK